MNKLHEKEFGKPKKEVPAPQPTKSEEYEDDFLDNIPMLKDNNKKADIFDTSKDKIPS